ncbi:hypothetical protein L9F63_022284 [Diploptera punctata]|uniref:DNA-directed RNA polymerase subunit n=1 Tax=Diploptera punctata TaxID=6984 RepID=A0AAD8EB75_DIPPU|nr:hypothetical protein L9F63_022284 [Diploptera punctata]
MSIKLTSEPGFCPDCGTILPLLSDKDGVRCYICKKVYGSEVFPGLECNYTSQFNSLETYSELKKGQESAEGPVVERKCPNCENDTMSYATLQLRSADEGQTVFYTCTKCKFKETENS